MSGGLRSQSRASGCAFLPAKPGRRKPALPASSEATLATKAQGRDTSTANPGGAASHPEQAANPRDKPARERGCIAAAAQAKMPQVELTPCEVARA
ncbi:MAG TPA: hypothetical protein DEP35_10760 [Deltaproteobacteria bacterium]|nr:hypothetical protein [Deltaproteobacteria bacterium]